MLENIQTGTGDLLGFQCLDQRSLVDDVTARGIQLRKELIRNEAPQVEIFYRSTLTSS